MAKGRKFKPPSAAVLEARGRREARRAENQAIAEWYIDDVMYKIQGTLKRRMQFAVQWLRDKTVQNISRPVTVGVGTRGQRVVTNRSKPGEFPKADTTQLMKTIFTDIEEVSDYVCIGRVGTPLDYGLILETRKNREFLTRTLREEYGRIVGLLCAPVD